MADDMKGMDQANYGPQPDDGSPCDTCDGKLRQACEGCDHYEEDE